MAAVVQDDVAGPAAALVAVDFPDQTLRDLVGRGLAPVGGHGVPRNRDKAELARESQYIGTASTEGRAKIADGLAGDLRENVARTCDFIEHRGRCGAGEIGVGPGMIADEVAGMGDAARQLRLGPGEFANHEKGSVYVVFGENVEQTRCPCGVGAVVEGEGELAGAARGDERTAEDLRSGPVGGVGKAGHTQTCGSDSAKARANLHDHWYMHIVFSVRPRLPMRK